jgi:UDP-N-acetylglucosamine 2-epimerase (non-hydrolysing)
MRILHVVGARPNFMKVAPVMVALKMRQGVRQTLVHTGQHYDANLSDSIFEQLGLPQPDVNLGVGSASHAKQTAAIMVGLEDCLERYAPDLVLVYGDVNSTAAATLVAVKMGIRCGHVEAGLRSGDRTMPEEINRLVTDRLAEFLFTPSADADENLAREGVDPTRVFRVGNVMIDTLIRLLPASDAASVLRRLVPSAEGHDRFVLVTLHRPSNVDHERVLAGLMAALGELSGDAPVIFPIHPRTRSRLGGNGWKRQGLHLTEPLGYLEFLGLERAASLVVTDSGGVQEETTYLGVPCLTVRENTERPITVSMGTNTLIGRDPDRMLAAARAILRGEGKRGSVPPLWDGRAAVRIADVLTRAGLRCSA